jgi:uncharacterized protein (DUF433 family)
LGWRTDRDAHPLLAPPLRYNENDIRGNEELTVVALGRYIVADPEICHGQPTFTGTRILVADILDEVARGLDWETIVDIWGGDVTKEAIAEAIRLARQAFLTTATVRPPG